MANNIFDLEDRTEKFAINCRSLSRKLPKTLANAKDIDQLVRSSGSVASNYIEANESLSKKDYYYRVKICRKEAKESRLWLRLVFTDSNAELESDKQGLIKEATELMRIFGSIIEKGRE